MPKFSFSLISPQTMLCNLSGYIKNVGYIIQATTGGQLFWPQGLETSFAADPHRQPKDEPG